MIKRIVIAEDEPITRMDISETLMEAGYEVVGIASNGLSAVEIARKTNPDLIVMDINMPVLNGLEASKMIIEEAITNCIIIITEQNIEEFIDVADEIGIMGYVEKPINEKKLLSTIETAIFESKKMKSNRKYINNINTKIAMDF
ncbi:response regulator [Clostridium sp. MSJ-11]|uniref:Response regulator n=1 Tax=Clostridium mobile TaxID=2841512 RepID=A0ABS6EJ85_9CLOT|nr:response regulator [Clostridium mobile]MBU5485273.1 response regulator [Clostridium mobile]